MALWAECRQKNTRNTIEIENNNYFLIINSKHNTHIAGRTWSKTDIFHRKLCVNLYIILYISSYTFFNAYNLWRVLKSMKYTYIHMCTLRHTSQSKYKVRFDSRALIFSKFLGLKIMKAIRTAGILLLLSIYKIW